jgi:hypothetical protein
VRTVRAVSENLSELPGPDPDPVVAAYPVGEVVETAYGPEGLATATYDPSGAYRFRLSRVWDPGRGRCVFVMLNPSTATAVRLDRTVARCVRFAQAWGFGALEVVNVFAYRATDPRTMKAQSDPVGAGNDHALVAAGAAADLVVAAWGTHAAHGGREGQVRARFADVGVDLRCLRVTKKGHPGHPLYVRANTVPVPY